MNIRYRVELDETERAELTAMLGGGKHAVRKLKRAQILLAADAGIGCQSALKSFQVTASKSFQLVRRVSAVFCAA